MQSKLFVTNIFHGIYKKLENSFKNRNKKAGLTWIKTKYLKHASAGETQTYNYKGNKIYYSNPIELLHTLKEIFVEEIYKVSLPSDACIIDCGANIGLGIIYFKEKYPSAQIIAFEPDENNFCLLEKNVASFQLENVDLRNEAVWINDTEIDFSNDGTMGSKIATISSNSTRKVKAIKLATLLNKKVDFLKIDIEGAEYEIIKDIRNNLGNVQNMFLEYHGDFSQNEELSEILNILSEAGLNFYIKEAAEIYKSPFQAASTNKITDFDVQLNIFCFRKKY